MYLEYLQSSPKWENDLPTGQLPISIDISEVLLFEWCPWIYSFSYVLLCTSPLYVKPGRVKICFLQMKTLELLASWHVAVILSYLEPF